MPKASIFISYRQTDTRAWAVSVRDELAQAFGEDAVFLDTDALDAGRWSDQISSALDACKVLVLLVGTGWLAARADDGRRRLDDAQDVHRREIEQALQRQEVLVLPLLVDGAAMPAQTDLPPALAALCDRQALAWSRRADHRALDAARLLAAIQRHTGMVPRRPDTRPRWAGPALAVAGGIGGTVALVLLFSMIGMPLDPTETLVSFALCAGFSAAALALRAQWRRRTRLR